MAVVFVAAEKRELEGLRRHLLNTRALHWQTRYSEAGDLRGREVVLLANGAGPGLAADAAREAVRHQDKVEALVSTGYCGGLADGCVAGEVLIATAVNGRETRQPAPRGSARSGPLCSRNRVAVTREDKRALSATAVAVEMEAAGVLRVADEHGIPFYCVRVVTDGPQDEFTMDFNRMRDTEGRFRRGRIIAAACRNPLLHFPALMKLGRTCNKASGKLGDFLATCQF